MESLFREIINSCIQRLNTLLASDPSSEAGERERNALGEELPRYVKYLAMLPAKDRVTYMPACGGIRRLAVENDSTYLQETLAELNDLLSALQKGSYSDLRETPERMLWASMQNCLIRLRNMKYAQSKNPDLYEREKGQLQIELERYRRYTGVVRFKMQERQEHEFVLKGLGRMVNDGDFSASEEVEQKLISLLVG